MTATVGGGRGRDPRAVDEIEVVVDELADEPRRRGSVVGVVAVDEDVDVGIDVGEHSPDDIALALPALRPHHRAGLPGDLARPVAGVVVVDVDRRLRQRRPERRNDRGDRQLLVVAGDEDRGAGRRRDGRGGVAKLGGLMGKRGLHVGSSDQARPAYPQSLPR